ncbi:hypothetical protein [Fontibacillus sp. BL9]|uniref:hypothetical protein n=1 Tax=Fontibacillus sp. BL9 TaxID=3389971 RepID=UPI00397A75F4
MPNQLLIFLLLVVVVFISGFWLSVFLLGNKLRNYKFLFTFLLGTVWLILISSWVSYLGFSMKDSYLYILLVTVIIDIIALLSEIRNKRLREWIPGKYQIIVLFCGLISSLIILFPILYFKAFNPYTDGFTYISIADYLLNHSYFQPADPNPYYPWLTQMKLYQDAGYRMGAQFLLSFMTALFNREMSLEVYMPVTALSQFLLVVVMWLFCKEGIKISTKASLIAVFFTAIHLSIPINSALWGFYPQAFGVVLGAAVFMLFLNKDIWEGPGSSSDRWKMLIVTSLVSASTVITYSEYVPFIALSVFFLLVFHLIVSKSYKYVFSNIIGLIILISIFSNVGLIKAIGAIRHQLGVVVGWHIPYDLWQYLLMTLSLNPIYNAHSMFLNHHFLFFIVSCLASLILFIVLKYFILNRDMAQYRRQIFLVASSFILMLIYFTFFADNPWFSDKMGHSWNIHKIIQYMFFIFPPIIGLSLYDFWNKSKINKFISTFLVLGYIPIVLVFTYHYSLMSTEQMRTYTGNNENPIYEYYKLKDTYKDEKRPINLALSTDLTKHRQMIAYFLKNNNLVSDWSDDGYISGSMSAENRNLSFDSKGITLMFNQHAANKIANMELVTGKVITNFISGVYGLEKNETQSWHWSSGDVKINVFNPSVDNEKKIARFIFSVGLPPGVAESKAIDVIYNGNHIKELVIEPTQSNPIDLSLEIDPGESKLELKMRSGPVKIAGEDRELGFSIIDFQSQ